MAFTHLIAHQIVRDKPNAAAAVEYRSRDVPLTGIADEFARELKHAYVKKLGKIFGRFSDEAGNAPLPAWVNDYLIEKSSFASLSKRFTEHFVSALDNSEELAEGYLIFAYEELEGTQAILITWVAEASAQKILTMSLTWKKFST